MKPRNLPKYVMLIKRGRNIKFYYPHNDEAMSGIITHAIEKRGGKLLKMYRADYKIVAR